MKVLVVDDSSIMRRVIEQILRGLGHVAVQAGDGLLQDPVVGPQPHPPVEPVAERAEGVTKALEPREQVRDR